MKLGFWSYRIVDDERVHCAALFDDGEVWFLCATPGDVETTETEALTCDACRGEARRIRTKLEEIVRQRAFRRASWAWLLGDAA